MSDEQFARDEASGVIRFRVGEEFGCRASFDDTAAMHQHDVAGETLRLGEIVLMHRGRVIEIGPAGEFFANPKSQDARRFIAGELLV